MSEKELAALLVLAIGDTRTGKLANATAEIHEPGIAGAAPVLHIHVGNRMFRVEIEEVG